MKHTIEVSNEQLIIIRDLLGERLEDIEEEIAYYTENPAALKEDAEGEELTIEDYEEYRDEVQTLLDCLPETEA
ncbi:hypothetical protein J7643_15125 [bacterium]|nr:hypothetical protein [bacterium]